ncbi:lipid-A-disaccharide synthase [Bauldia sp.]|uniref:lipid-A-disaccharide synthase n=1 Tax=Bauldia sp. TaxID=2575872 RepID=UPI003BACD952
MTERPFIAFLIAGEESGDHLGARVMEAMSDRLGGQVRFVGVGGDRMEAHGMTSLFPMHEIAYHGISAIIVNAHRIVAKMRKTAQAVIEADPDVLVIIDCPGFNLGVARRVRKRKPTIPIVEYVSPTVWVWRPGRARWISGFVDHVLAILPFEPDVHRRLGGPPCTYVGHPLMQRLDRLRPTGSERPNLGDADRPTLLVLPGSRRNEIKRLTEPFGQALDLLIRQYGDIEVVLPAVARLEAEIRERTAAWPVQPEIIVGEEAKYAAFRRAHVALAASGTVTLELALAGVPMAVAYRVDPFVKPFKYALSRVNSFVLPNLITGTNEIPEFLDSDSTPENLAGALLPLLSDSKERRDQLDAFSRLDALMALDNGTPSGLAADIVLGTAGVAPRESSEASKPIPARS